MRTKLKNVRTGQVIENTLLGSDRFDEIRIEKSKKQSLYDDGGFYVFMDNTTYEQLQVPHEVVGDKSKFMIENIEVTIRSTPDGEIVDIELPITVGRP
jgi:elongation factor P